jgi:hypothetical protein
MLTKKEDIRKQMGDSWCNLTGAAEDISDSHSESLPKATIWSLKDHWQKKTSPNRDTVGSSGLSFRPTTK